MRAGAAAPAAGVRGAGRHGGHPVAQPARIPAAGPGLVPGARAPAARLAVPRAACLRLLPPGRPCRCAEPGEKASAELAKNYKSKIHDEPTLPDCTREQPLRAEADAHWESALAESLSRKCGSLSSMYGVAPGVPALTASLLATPYSFVYRNRLMSSSLTDCRDVLCGRLTDIAFCAGLVSH